jgi:hypothetical protein
VTAALPDCGKPLTGEEATYYEHRCEQCERDVFERVERWRKGEDDPELDRLYDVPPETRH